MVIKQLPREHFAHLPTVIEPLPNLSAFLNGPRLFIKRDDQTGLAFGGNKTRKLEFLVAEAKANSAKTLITTGALQSNHCRQTAAAAARFGMDCILVLVGKPPQSPSANLLLDLLMNAEIVWTEKSTRDETLQEVFEEATKAGKRPYLVPYGGSSPVGATAYAFAIQELLEQKFRPDWIVFASSSGGTQAGMVAGVRAFGFGGKILGISVDETQDVLKPRVAYLATEVLERMGIAQNISPDEIIINDDFLGGGYGVMGKKEIESIKLFARKEGILLDPVYTGKAAAGLVSLIQNNFFPTDSTVLFWHTGGTPSLFADRYRALADAL